MDENIFLHLRPNFLTNVGESSRITWRKKQQIQGYLRLVFQNYPVILGGGFKYLLLSSLLGEMIQFD